MTRRAVRKKTGDYNPKRRICWKPPNCSRDPLSSAIAALRFPGTASIKANPTSGFRTDSVALVFQLRAFDRGRIKGKIGEVSESELVEIRLELAKLLGS